MQFFNFTMLKGIKFLQVWGLGAKNAAFQLPASGAVPASWKGENAANTMVLEEQVQEMPQNPGFFGYMPYITM